MRFAPTSRVVGLGVLLSVVCMPAAQAQLVGGAQDTRNDLNVEHYDPPPSPLGMANILESKSQRWREWSVGLYLNYARNQLVLFQERLQIGEAVGHRMSADLVGSIGLLDWIEVGAVLPFTVVQFGDDGLPTGELKLGGLRDPRLHAKIEIFNQAETGVIGLSFVPEVSLPIGTRDAFLGDGSVTFTPMVVADRHFDWLWGVRIAGTIGARVRPEADIGNILVDDEAFYRIGAGVRLPNWADLHPEVIAELNGTTGLDDLFSDKERNPFFPTLATKWYYDVDYGHQLVTTVGVNVGATRGYGSPDYQIFAGLAYRRWLSDRDEDGIYDDDDFCPDDPEDKDQFEDLDGCPDPDNDRDGIPDVSDRCPNEPEDIDGFQDLDGCPDPDNDKDRILDVDDQCPLDPEDYDGFQDEDGCPEPDNDLDGIPDGQDKCPDEKETINGIDDYDGCPDEGDAHVEVTGEKITIDTKIFFEFDSAVLLEESFSILNQVALVMLANPQLTKVQVEGHTDERGSDDYNLLLSQRRAESVVAYLVARGVADERLEAIGYGELRPLIEEHDEAAWAKNRRVEFTIVQQGPEPTTGGRSFEIPVEDGAQPVQDTPKMPKKTGE